MEPYEIAHRYDNDKTKLASIENELKEQHKDLKLDKCELGILRVLHLLRESGVSKITIFL